MQNRPTSIALAAAFTLIATAASPAYAGADHDDRHHKVNQGIQLGPRPFYLVDGMDEGPLKNRLSQCKNGPFSRTDFSIGHRGAAQQFPEHTKEAYDAGARMGAGIVECDVTFTGVNYDTVVFFDQTQGIPPGPFSLPATGPAYVKADAGRSSPFYLEGSSNQAGTAFYVAYLAPDLSGVRIARYAANFIPRNEPVSENVDDANSHVGFWAPQPDFRIPERLSPGFVNFPDLELEAIYQDQVRLRRLPDPARPAVHYKEPGRRSRHGLYRAAGRFGSPVLADRSAASDQSAGPELYRGEPGSSKGPPLSRLSSPRLPGRR